MPTEAEEVVAASPEPFTTAEHVRSTILVASVAQLRAMNYFDAYAEQMAADDLAIVLGAVAGSWVPMRVVLAHFAAHEKLGFSPQQAYGYGRVAFDGLGGLLMGTAVGMARRVGVTPWTVLPHCPRFWGRAYDGGGIRIAKAGPKEARLELWGLPLLDIPYYAWTFCGVAAAGIELFSKRAHGVVTENSHGAAQMRLQWI